MPIYEYKCADCEHEFEVWRKMSDQTPVTCLHCMSDRTEQLLSMSSFQLKGSGWAHDSYGVNAPNTDASNDADA